MLVESNIQEVGYSYRKALGWPDWALTSTVDIRVTPSNIENVDRTLLIATTLPLELTRIVLDWIFYEAEPQDPIARSSWRRQFGRLSLTCRHWAELCKPRLFSNVWISSLQGLRGVKNLHTWAPRAEAFILDIDLICKGAAAPWTHLLSIPSSSPFPRWKKTCRDHETRVSLDVDVDDVLSSHPSQVVRFRSLYHLVPKPIPGSFSHVSEISLSNHHFSRLSDLLHLIWEVPSIRTLHCKQLSWNDPSEPPRLPLTRGSSLARVYTTDCPNAHNLVWLHTTLGSLVQSRDLEIQKLSVLEPSEQVLLSEFVHEFVKLHRILDSLEESPLDSVPEGWVFLWDGQSEDPWEAQTTIGPGSAGKASLVIHYGLPHPSHAVNPFTVIVPTSLSTFCITKLTLTFHLEDIKVDISRWDLRMLDERASLIPHLRRCQVNLQGNVQSFEVMESKCTPVAQTIALQMPGLWGSGKLQFEAVDETTGMDFEMLDIFDPW